MMRQSGWVAVLCWAAGVWACTATVTDAPDTAQVISVDVQPRNVQLLPGETQAFASAVTGTLDTAVVWEVVEAGGGTIDGTGRYTAPASSGQYHVKASSRANPAVTATASVDVTAGGGCWQLLPVNRARLVPRSGAAAAMVGGTIQGSNDSPTNGFVVLATISSTPADNPTYTELTFANATPYRYVKYYGPSGSYGQVAEVELYSGANRLTGAGFGTAGSRSGNPWPNALDGDPATFFDAAIADAYVGVDAASDHLVAAPVFSPAAGTYPGPTTITITSSTPGATIRYTTDGSDPTTGTVYTAPIVLASGSRILRAVATSACAYPNAVTGVYEIGTPNPMTQASLHLGNSITDSIDNWLQPVATSGGITLDFQRYTLPGAGTWLYNDDPIDGCCTVSGNVRTDVANRHYDHISIQPFSNNPCAATGYASQNPAANRSDTVNGVQVWDEAQARSPNVQMWVMDQWVPRTQAVWANCINGGAWIRDPDVGEPAWNPPNPTTWEIAQQNEETWAERVRAGMASLRPGRPAPYIVPAGRAYRALKAQIEAGAVPGFATSSFFTQMYADDTHASTNGRYFVSLVFYAAMFQRSPVGLSYSGTTLTASQAAVFQQIAWDTVRNYTLSGINRP